MRKKVSNLKIVQQQTPTEAGSKAIEHKEESWRLTRQEITARARALRIELEKARARLEAMTFDVVTDDALDIHSMINCETLSVTALVEAFDPCIPGHYKRLDDAIPHNDCLTDDLSNLKWQTAETAFHIGILQGAIFAGCSDREIDRLERGLIHATASRHWRCKE